VPEAPHRRLTQPALAASLDGAFPSHVRAALVHDYLLVMRGAERTFSKIASLWPDAPIYTLLYDATGTEGRFGDREVRASTLRHLRVRQHNFRRLLPLFSKATERLPLQEYDVIISSSSAFAHGVRRSPGSVHVCYCHTPFRYAWHDYADVVGQSNRYARPFVARLLRGIRDWDLESSKHVTHYVANSQLTRERIHDFWGRDAAVVHPPVDVHRFYTAPPEDYFLVVAELVRHKRVEVALEAASRAAQPIKVVGSGPEFKRFARTYGSTAEFLGRVSDRELLDIYAHARALVVPNIEEFGIAAVEAQASGRPVLAASVGGTCETVVDGETGVLVTPENVGALAEAMSQVDFESFSPQRIQSHAAKFSVPAFQQRFIAEVSQAVNGSSAGTGVAAGAAKRSSA
jgi:glycosyltransferase involved in cell wall biosynthesis